MKKIIHVVGARPNFMKAAPVLAEMGNFPDQFESLLVHTGQHYDANMSKVFFDELGLPEPDVYLGVGSDSHARQTARIMIEFEEILQKHRPDLVSVVGDVNSTLACALTAAKLGVPVAHVEAGLRSFDRTMPEEINRILTDHASDFLFTTETSGNENLEKEGISLSKVHFVGNVMIDSLVRLLPVAQRRWEQAWAAIGASSAEDYVLVTLHRPANVDDLETLGEILEALRRIAADHRVVFPVHPRTRSRIQQLGSPDLDGNLLLSTPLGYLDFMALMSRASLILTDSGGIQEETTYLKIPCLTVRPNTERPITITQGTNQLVAANAEALVEKASEALTSRSVQDTEIPALWDGKAAQRIVDVLRQKWPA